MTTWSDHFARCDSWVCDKRIALDSRRTLPNDWHTLRTLGYGWDYCPDHHDACVGKAEELGIAEEFAIQEAWPVRCV